MKLQREIYAACRRPKHLQRLIVTGGAIAVVAAIVLAAAQLLGEFAVPVAAVC